MDYLVVYQIGTMSAGLKTDTTRTFRSHPPLVGLPGKTNFSRLREKTNTKFRLKSSDGRTKRSVLDRAFCFGEAKWNVERHPDRGRRWCLIGAIILMATERRDLSCMATGLISAMKPVAIQERSLRSVATNAHFISNERRGLGRDDGAAYRSSNMRPGCYTVFIT